MAVRLKLVPYLALHWSKGDEIKITIRTKSYQNKIIVRLLKVRSK